LNKIKEKEKEVHSKEFTIIKESLFKSAILSCSFKRNDKKINKYVLKRNLKNYVFYIRIKSCKRIFVIMLFCYNFIICRKLILFKRNSNFPRKTPHCILLHYHASRGYWSIMEQRLYLLTPGFKVHNVTVNVDTRMERSSHAFGSFHAGERNTSKIKSNGI